MFAGATGRVRGLWLALGIVAASTLIRSARADADGITTLLARLGRAPGVSANFREEKRIPLLSEPLISTGSVYFTKPAALLRRVVTPEANSLLLANGRLEFRDAAGQRSFDLSSMPAVRSLAESFLYVLSGDRNALDRLYSMRFQGAAQAAWKLQLTPKTKELARLIREIKLEGDDIRVRSMQLTEASGDVSVTTFTDVQSDRHFSDQEKRTLFQVPQKP